MRRRDSVKQTSVSFRTGWEDFAFDLQAGSDGVQQVTTAACVS